MSSLLDQVPETTVFFNEVIENIAQYRLFPEERFESYLQGIVATTEVILKEID